MGGSPFNFPSTKFGAAIDRRGAPAVWSAQSQSWNPKFRFTEVHRPFVASELVPSALAFVAGGPRHENLRENYHRSDGSRHGSLCPGPNSDLHLDHRGVARSVRLVCKWHGDIRHRSMDDQRISECYRVRAWGRDVMHYRRLDQYRCGLDRFGQ
jgi:hypothetical protein